MTFVKQRERKQLTLGRYVNNTVECQSQRKKRIMYQPKVNVDKQRREGGCKLTFRAFSLRRSEIVNKRM